MRFLGASQRKIPPGVDSGISQRFSKFILDFLLRCFRESSGISAGDTAGVSYEVRSVIFFGYFPKLFLVVEYLISCSDPPEIIFLQNFIFPELFPEPLPEIIPRLCMLLFGIFFF